MGRLPQDLEEKRQHLESAARRGAFESYIRHGRVPEAYERIAALVNEARRLMPRHQSGLWLAGYQQAARRPTTRGAQRATTVFVARMQHATAGFSPGPIHPSTVIPVSS